jgi:hypothetical protein
MFGRIWWEQVREAKEIQGDDDEEVQERPVERGKMKEKAKGKTAKFWVASRHLTSSRRHIVQTRAPEVPEIRGSSIVMCQKSANLTVSQIPECHGVHAH